MNGYYKPICLSPAADMLRTLIVVLVSFCALATTAAHADGDEATLFVSLSGSDSGNCQSAISPCRTISYALRRVGKNARLRVSAGTFELAAVEDVAYLLSGAIDAQGSFRENATTTLIGVPHEFAAELARRGFRVIADSKGAGSEQNLENRKFVQTQLSLKSNAAAEACVAGSAGIFPCNNVDLLAHIADRTPAARGADIWGFMDLNSNREYVIVGYSTGTAVYDVSDAENPREVGFIDGQSTTWRDIKIYQFWNATAGRWNAYAYITADAATDGLFIIDLSQLPVSVSRMNYASDFSSAHNVYLADVEFSTGLSISGDAPILILAGSNLSDGRFRAYSLSNPASPSFIAAPATPAGQAGNDRLYMHDAASMIVTDSRKDTQCVNAAASDHCDVLFDFNESTVDIWDITDPSNAVRLSQTPYANADYVHSGWWSEDQQFMFVQDETDERDRGLPTTLRAFSIADLTAPTLAGSWPGPTNAIDHNGFVRGNRYYMSNYTRGLSILDITDPANPAAAGRFDTYPSSDGVGFPGNWGVYPFLPSGNIALSDIDSGFYMVSDNTLDEHGGAGSLAFAAGSFAAAESQSANITVQRSGGATGSTSVDWQIIGATGSTNDVAASSGTLTWADGDAAAKTINLALTNDGTQEGLERLLIRLVAPVGGATLAAPNIASLYIGDPNDTPIVEFATAATSIAERGFATAVAIVHRSGSASGAVSVDYAVSAGSATAGTDYSGPTSGTLNWADGDGDPKWVEFAVSDDGNAEADEFFDLTLSGATGGAIGANSQLRVNILDGTGSNSAPNSVAGNSQTVASGANVTLNGSGSNDPDGDTLTYAWRQTMGPTVTLNSATSASATFVAPSVSSDTLLQFELTVSDPGNQTDTSLVNVTVTSNSTTGGTGGGGGGTLSLCLLMTLLGFSIRRRLAIQTGGS